MPLPPDGRCGDAAIYLLGLLDEQQSARFTAHADTCAVCRDEVGALTPAVDLLPATVPQLDAPEHVKRRVMTIVHAEVRADAQTEQADATREHHEDRSRAGAWRLRAAWARLSAPQGMRRPALALLATALLAGGIAIGAQLSGGGGGGSRVFDADVTIAGARAALHES